MARRVRKLYAIETLESPNAAPNIDANFDALFSLVALMVGRLTPGTFGSATAVPQIVVSSDGVITSIESVTIEGGGTVDEAFVMATSGI